MAPSIVLVGQREPDPRGSLGALRKKGVKYAKTIKFDGDFYTDSRALY